MNECDVSVLSLLIQKFVLLMLYLMLYQVIITTYQTLSSDFALPSDLENGHEMEWLVDNGSCSF